MDVTDLMHMSCNSNFARVFLNQDVEVSSPQPQPIDDVAGVRAAPWDDSAPRAVQVISRHRAIDLIPLLCSCSAEIVRNDGVTPRSQSSPLKGIASVRDRTDCRATVHKW